MKHNKIFASLICMACAIGFYSCSDDDGPKPTLQNPVVSETAAAYNSLTFEWSAVENAVQYGYQLYDPENIAVKAGVTHDKTVTLTGLKPATTYTLKVWAFSSMDGDYSTPAAVELTATTDPLIKLASPANLALTTENGYNYTASWDAVDNATIYICNVRDTEGSLAMTDTITTTTLDIKNLETGEYTFYVFAAAHDGYDLSDTVSESFYVEQPEAPIYTVKGTYYSFSLDSSWSANMEAYSDGSYIIRAYYGVEGYDLNFRINENDPSDMFEILNGEMVQDPSNGYWTWDTPTGLSNPSMLKSYPWYNYSYFDGNQTEGEVGIGCYDSSWNWGYDTFTWGGSGSDSSVDALVGTYDCHFTGWDYYLTSNNGYSYWDDTWTDYATISKVDDQTVSIDGLFYTEQPVLGTVDFTNLTITLDFTDTYYYYYTVASVDGHDIHAIGYINSDGTITFADWALWYNYGTASSPQWYAYLEGTSVLTPSSTKATIAKKCNPYKQQANKANPKAAPKHGIPVKPTYYPKTR